MSLFNYGFRPFFLMASLYASLLIPLWLLFLTGKNASTSIAYPQYWHAHEMVFGFAGAVLAGFLFTASANWTGKPGVQGKPLAVLSFVWLAGRVALFATGFTSLSFALDMLFWVGLVLLLYPFLWDKEAPRNKMFLVILSLLTLGNLVFWYSLENSNIVSPSVVLGLALEIFVGIMLLILGRILPFFSSKALGVTIGKNSKIIERGLFVGFGIFFVSGLIDHSVARAMSAGLIFICMGFRVSQWTPLQSYKSPLLAVLYAGYFWLMLGFFFEFLDLFAVASTGYGKHAFAMGGVGVLCLGMMVRVSLGHTGRKLVVPKAVIALFIIINFGTYMRLIPPIVNPEGYMLYLKLSGLMWTLAFTGVAFYLAPKLLTARADGRPG